MKKKFLSIITVSAVVCLMFGMTACGTNKKTEETSLPTASSSESVEQTKDSKKESIATTEEITTTESSASESTEERIEVTSDSTSTTAETTSEETTASKTEVISKTILDTQIQINSGSTAELTITK